MDTNKVAPAFYFGLPALFVFIIESLITYYNIQKFRDVNPVKWMPKGWIFSIVWITLFVLMSWGGYIYYVNQPNSTNQINFLSVFYVQLLFNFLWVLVFFTNPNKLTGQFALMILLFLFLSVLYLIIASWEISAVSFSFFLAYGVWLVFAALLNIAFITGLSQHKIKKVNCMKK